MHAWALENRKSIYSYHINYHRIYSTVRACALRRTSSRGPVSSRNAPILISHFEGWTFFYSRMDNGAQKRQRIGLELGKVSEYVVLYDVVFG